MKIKVKDKDVAILHKEMVRLKESSFDADAVFWFHLNQCISLLEIRLGYPSKKKLLKGMCVCGHMLGEHINNQGFTDCVKEIENGDVCNCTKFTEKKK